MRESERRREGITTTSRMYHPKEKKKSGTSGCGSFVFPYFQPATSTTDRLQLHIYISCVCQTVVGSYVDLCGMEEKEKTKVL